MLAKHQKLQLRQEKEFFKKAQRLVRQPFIVYIAHTHNTPSFTVVVPKRIATKATQRNRIKRVIYQIIQERLQTSTLKNVAVALVLQRQTSDEQLSEVVNTIVTENAT